MHRCLIIVLACLLSGCASSNTQSFRQQAGKPYDPAIPETSSNCIPVVISFAGNEFMDADELKYRAKQKLSAEGYQLDESYFCSVNVELIGKGAGCTVTFGRGIGRKMYVVEFDRKGEVHKVRVGYALEGPP